MTLEAVLLYKPGGSASEGEFRVVASSSPEALRSIARASLAEARASAERWRSVDLGIARMREAEADRLERILSELLPPEPEATAA